MKTGNYLNQIGIDNEIKSFQKLAYQILYGTYIDEKFRTIGKIIEFEKLQKLYPNNLFIGSEHNIGYFRISASECSRIVQFLDDELNIVCGVETLPEENKFYN